MIHLIYKVRFLLTAIFFLVVAGCSNNELPKIPNDGVILAFGDSLTSGVGVKLEHSYPTQLAKLTGLTVINAGVSGETTQQGVERFNQILDESNPDLIVLLEGGNDILRNMSEEQTAANLSNMIERAQSDDIPVLLIGVPKKSLFSSSASFYAELSDKYNLILDDKTIASLIKNPKMKSDSVHFNQKGYHELANSIYQHLVDHGALD